MRYFGLPMVAVFLAIIGLNSSCMKCGEKASEKIAEGIAEKATGGKAKVDVGSVDISALPANLRYPNAVAKMKWEITGDKGSGTAWTFETKDPRGNVVQFYKNALANWKQSAIAETPKSTSMVIVAPDEKETVMIMVSDEGDKTVFHITHSQGQ